MAIMHVKNLKKTYGPKLIFENVSFEINAKDRIALVGRNGTGKTTIFKILTGNEYQDSGDVYIKKELKVGYLEQEPEYGDMSVYDVLCLAKKDVLDLNDYMVDLQNKMSAETNIDKLMKLSDKYGKMLNKYEEVGGYELDSDIAKITAGLKISKEMQNMSFQTLSGGEKTRVLLAKLLLEKPEVMLLDEPTNHLDIDSMEWLEKHINNYQGALLLVSHDRYFLDNVVNKIYELDNDGVEIYDGNYSRYAIEKELRYINRMKSYNSQKYVINRMEMQIKKFRALNTPGLNKLANIIEHRLDRMEKLPKPILEKRKMKLSDTASDRSGNEVLKIKNLEKTYGNQTIFTNVNLNMRYKDRMGLIGKNGCGKTTLIKIILGEEKQSYGEVKIGTKLNVGYLRQNTVLSNKNSSILEYYCQEFAISPQEARNRLAKILFTGNDVFKKINSLSGGEKKRLELSVLLDKQPNFLILDEPTNHLDLASREILEESLEGFEGNLLIVSHDRYFLNKLANGLWVHDKDTFISVDGNYEYFRQNKEKFLETQKITQDKNSTTSKSQERVFGDE